MDVDPGNGHRACTKVPGGDLGQSTIPLVTLRLRWSRISKIPSVHASCPLPTPPPTLPKPSCAKCFDSKWRLPLASDSQTSLARVCGLPGLTERNFQWVLGWIVSQDAAVMAAEVGKNPEEEMSPWGSSRSGVASLWRRSCAEDLTVSRYSCGIQQGPHSNILIINEGWHKVKAKRAIYFPKPGHEQLQRKSHKGIRVTGPLPVCPDGVT